ncbi:hypothetical protein BH20ACT9_BH20ACT9_07530 [soil metagenome]
MPDMLVRGLPEATHEELKRRADARGVSLQAYVLRLLQQHTARPPIEWWLQRLDELPKVHTRTGGAEAVAATREELP